MLRQREPRNPAATAPSTRLGALEARLVELLGEPAVIADLERRRTYECDGLTNHRSVPALVVLPDSTAEVAEVVRACVAAGVPYVARGAGTGLSAGALPAPDGVLIVLTRLRSILEIDLASQRAVLQPGVTNLEISKAVAANGYFYAPDPSSQAACTIGGNVAENSGGAHCLKYGFTTNHVTGLVVLDAAGKPVRLGGKAPDPPGYDLIGAYVGSEGTLGVVTEVTVRLTRLPEAVVTLLAGFASTEQAGEAVSAIIAAGIVPAAIEMMDALAITAVEVAVHADYPPGAGAVLLVELDGPSGEVAEELEAVQSLMRRAGAFEVRHASSPAERALLWKGRKSAFAAVGRISPNFIVQDGVVPRSSLPEVLHAIDSLVENSPVRVANVFHAGDGNLHPLVLFDASHPGELEEAERISTAILELCVAYGGSITGEHGVGRDKQASLAKMYDAGDLDTMQRLRCAFDPLSLANPDKVFPTPRLCGEAPRVRQGTEGLAFGGGEVF